MTEYVDDKDFKNAIEDMLDDKNLPELNPIREHEAVLFGLLCVRMNSKDEEVQGKGPPIVLKKLAAPYQTLMEGHYLLIGDNYFWTHVDEKKKKAALFHALLHIEITVSEKEVVRYATRKPPVQAWPSEVAKFGAHTEVLLDFREAMKFSANQFAESMKTRS